MQTLVISQPHLVQGAERPPLKVVAFGDSLVYGFGDPIGGGWVERLRRSWMNPESPGPVLYNLGIRGDCVKQVSRRLTHEFRLRGELRNQVPDLIILSVGVNDSTRLARPNGKNFTPFEEFQAELVNLLECAKRLCPVLFIGMVPVDEAKMPFLNYFYFNHTDQYRYKEATRLACEQHQIPYLDIFSRWLSHGDEWYRARLSEDGLHPNTLGYETLLDEVIMWPALQNHLVCSV